MPLPFEPVRLNRGEPFSHPDWLFEIKWDGFRSIAKIEHGRCKLISRNQNEFKSFTSLNEALTEIKAESAVLDGEIVCLDDDGKTQFTDLLFRRGEPRFIAFDILSYEGQNLRYSPLIERKQRLRSIIHKRQNGRLLYCDYVENDGIGLFRLACANDLEGIVAKPKFSPYLPEQANWRKIRNRNYSQWAGRQNLFEQERESDPDMRLWESCSACLASDAA